LLIALIQLPRRWATLSADRRWLYWALLLGFIFLTFSGSRRSYYVLPLVPLGVLIIADWLCCGEQRHPQWRLWWYRLLVMVIILLSLVFFIFYPFVDSQGGPRLLAQRTVEQAKKIAPWSAWHIIMLGGEDQVLLYLQSVYPINYQVLTADSMDKLTHLPQWVDQWSHTIVIVSRKDLSKVENHLMTSYQLIEVPRSWGNRYLDKRYNRQDVALIIR
jgi:4-amino-4-deoxy-L-arabinose transferase-like glycosyltransferase